MYRKLNQTCCRNELYKKRKRYKLPALRKMAQRKTFKRPFDNTCNTPNRLYTSVYDDDDDEEVTLRATIKSSMSCQGSTVLCHTE
jgi:hypothetical protein